MTATGSLEAAHQALDRWAWREAFEQLTASDRQQALGADDLDALGTAAYLAGEQQASVTAWERAHGEHVAAGEMPEAVRSAFWLGLTLMLRGQHAQGGGWLGRAGRELEGSPEDCPERGYLAVAAGLQALGGGDTQGARDTFAEVVRTADRFADADLRALGLLGQGQALSAGGEAAPGLALLDEAMVGITTDEVDPIVAGVVYCAVIITCRDALDVARAQEWTAALTSWCARQPDLVPFRGQCLVHRSELLQLRGDWTGAAEEAQRACDELLDPPGDPVLGMALYQRAELLRLRGAFDLAETAYRQADACGHPAQPGLALLRLAQGRQEEARSAIVRTVTEPGGARDRLHNLSACVDILLALGDVDEAGAAVAEMAGLSTGLDSVYLRAVVGYARGTVLLAEDRPAEAGAELRRARRDWQQLDAPYEVARTRVRMAQACQRVGDHGTATMELEAAVGAFDRLGAKPARAGAQALLARAGRAVSAPDGLTAREVEVLRLVATGASNRDVAEALVISDRTVARHLSNVFTKLGLSSRSAATAYAYEHDLVRHGGPADDAARRAGGEAGPAPN